MNLHLFYTKKEKQLAYKIAQQKQKSSWFVAGQVALFILFIAFLVLYTLVQWGFLPLILSFVTLLLYGIVRYMDIKNDKYVEQMSYLQKVYLKELSYLKSDFSCFGNGKQYIDIHHPFTFDLDIFGNNSLFQRINRTVTTGGSDYLAAQLSSTENKTERAEALDEIAKMEEWRAHFMALGQAEHIDSKLVHRALYLINKIKIPNGFIGKPFMLVVACGLMIGLWAAIIAAIIGWCSTLLPIWWAVLQFFAIIFLCQGTCKAISKIVDKLYAPLQVYRQMMKLIATANFRTYKNSTVAEQLKGAIIAFDKLNDILIALDRRGNLLGMLIMNTLFVSDVFLVRKFLNWQKMYINKISGWIDCMSEVDALVSMATFRYNEPQACKAQVIDSNEMIYEAEDLYHPFLGEKAVKNNFTLQHLHYYIITGANMAGKSTFLRAVGINYILALNGMPVFASSLRVSVYNLFSSMRTTDDLAHGISYFNAELLRLQQLIDTCKHNRQTLIILDEILKGTNSLDKLNGSRLFLESISKLPVTGIIATHDLELSKMQNSRFHNYCFEIALGKKVAYSYKITQGVARNQNATFLLKEILQNL